MNYGYLYIIRFLDAPNYYKGCRLCPKGILPENDIYFGSPVTHNQEWIRPKEKAIIKIISHENRDKVFQLIRKLEYDYITLDDINDEFCYNEAKSNGSLLININKIKEAAKRLHKEKDEQGRSIHAMQTIGKIHVYDENGVDLHNLKVNKIIHRKDTDGKSIHNKKMHNNHKNQDGKSEVALKMNKKIHQKDSNGKSIHNNKLHSKKDEQGRSLQAMKSINSPNHPTKQRWKCLVTGHISSPGPLTNYQKARNIDPSLRERLS
ncbi:MAG: hypothetical protein R3321_01920 [Nitrososphaeraceae archaeon]|nr:hypothetical protein [Nitrososphaeraceae archaeon]